MCRPKVTRESRDVRPTRAFNREISIKESFIDHSASRLQTFRLLTRFPASSANCTHWTRASVTHFRRDRFASACVTRAPLYSSSHIVVSRSRAFTKTSRRASRHHVRVRHSRRVKVTRNRRAFIASYTVFESLSSRCSRHVGKVIDVIVSLFFFLPFFLSRSRTSCTGTKNSKINSDG